MVGLRRKSSLPRLGFFDLRFNRLPRREEMEGNLKSLAFDIAKPGFRFFVFIDWAW